MRSYLPAGLGAAGISSSRSWWTEVRSGQGGLGVFTPHDATTILMVGGGFGEWMDEYNQ